MSDQNRHAPPAPTADTTSTPSRQHAQAPSTPWPDREPLGDAPTKPAPLDPALIPEPLRDYCVDTAERLGVKTDQVFVGILVAAAAVTGSTAQLQMKLEDTAFRVSANLYGGIVGEPGTKKTAAISAGTAFLTNIEQQHLDAHNKERTRRQSEIQALEARIAGVSKAIASAEETSEATQVKEFTEKHRDLRDEQAKLDPPAPRLSVSDATPEALTRLLAENPRGLLYRNDELATLFEKMAKKGYETMRTLMLQAWNGLPVTEDRMGRGTTRVDSATLSLLGGIQPATLRAAMPALNAPNGEDGFFARMQLLVWIDLDDLPYDIDHPPDKAAMQRARETFEHLDRRALERQRAINEGKGSEVFTLTEEAYEHITAYRHRLHDQARQAVQRRQYLYAAHLGKTGETAGRVALTFHLIDVAAGSPTPRVTLDTAERATTLMDYFLQHAHLTYGLHLHPESKKVDAIARLLERGTLHEKPTNTIPATVKSVATTAEAERLLQHFIDRHWVRLVERRSSDGIRSTRLMLLHPDLRLVTEETEDREEFDALSA